MCRRSTSIWKSRHNRKGQAASAFPLPLREGAGGEAVGGPSGHGTCFLVELKIPSGQRNQAGRLHMLTRREAAQALIAATAAATLGKTALAADKVVKIAMDLSLTGADSEGAQRIKNGF